MAARKKNSWVKWLIILLVIGGVGYSVYRYRQSGEKDPIEYRSAAATRGDITQSVTANGSISAVKNVQVGSQISGTIKEIKVDFNSKVKDGEVIAQIDPSTYERNVDEAVAQVASAQAALDLARVSLTRARQLASNNLVPIADLDQAQATFNQSEANLKIREAALKRAKVDLERTTIYAPISGVVISRNIEVGQTVAASFNTPTLFVIANDLARMQIEAAVSEADVGGVEEGQNVDFNVDAYPTRQFHGTVKQVRFAPSTNQNVVTYTTIIDVNNDDLKLRPGMTANASIITAQKPNVLRIPNAALRFRPPEGAVLTGATNAPARAGTNSAAMGGAGGQGGGGFAGAPGPGAGGGRDREEMRKRFESMSPEERERFREQRMRGGGGMGGGQGPRREGMTLSRTVYAVTTTNEPDGKTVLRAISIKTGIADTSFTEVLEGLQEGDQVITGSTAPAQPLARPTGGSPFGGMGMRPR